MTPQEKALQYIVNPGQFVARQPIDRSETYITPDSNPEAIATLNDAETSTDKAAIQSQWDAHNQRKLSNATRFYAN